MQSGKTGTCRYVIENLITKEIIKPANCYYICGLNDKDLRNQMILDFDSILLKSNILFSKQLQKINSGIIEIDTPEFIIIDESHYAGLIDSQIDQFIKNVLNSNKLPYILSVSATPMCEIIKTNISKVILKTTKDYYGIQKIFELNRIFQSANLNGSIEDFITIFDKEFTKQHITNNFKYGIIRLNDQYYHKYIEYELLLLDYKNKINFINFHNENKEFENVNFNDLVKHAPTKFTIIWIYNTLRAGKQLNTTNIGFIHDSYLTNTDTTAQSLLGRICGYNKIQNDINCYVDLKAAERMLVWIKSNYEYGYIPIRSKNILNGNSCNELNWRLNPPIYISLADEYVKLFYGLKIKYGNKYPYKQKLINAILNSIIDDDFLYDKVNNIISNYKFGRFGGLMVLNSNNAYRSFKENWNAIYKAYLNKKSIRGFEVDSGQLSSEFTNKFYYIFCNMNNTHPEFGGCLIVYKKFKPDNPKMIYKTDIKIADKSRFIYN